MFNYIEWYKHKGIYERVLEIKEGTEKLPNWELSSLFLFSDTLEGHTYWWNLDEECNRAYVNGWRPNKIYLGGE